MMGADKHPEWYACWFDTPWYHLLYRHRDHREAELFIDQLLKLLQPGPASRFLDLACGKGRHAIYLNKKGYDVTGIDLSEKSIACARQSENDKLHFYVHDMRRLFRTNYFDVCLNLFTSFGYFETERDDSAVINSAVKALKPGGIFVLDFMNSKKAIATIKSSEVKVLEGIEFHLKRKVEKGSILKEIEFTDKGKNYHYNEKVRAYSKGELTGLFEKNGLKILHLRGNYQLDVFDEERSDRLIIVGRKQ